MQLGCSWGLMPAHTHLPASPLKLWTERHVGPVVQELTQTTVPSPLWVSALLAGPLLLPGRAITYVVCGWEPALAHRPACQLLSALSQAFRGGQSGPGQPLLHRWHIPVRSQGLEQAAAMKASPWGWMWVGSGVPAWHPAAGGSAGQLGCHPLHPQGRG